MSKPIEVGISRWTGLGQERYSLTCEQIQECLAAPPGGFQINISSSGVTASTRYTPTTKVKAKDVPDAMVLLICKLLDNQMIRHKSIDAIFKRAAEVAQREFVQDVFRYKP